MRGGIGAAEFLCSGGAASTDRMTKGERGRRGHSAWSAWKYAAFAEGTGHGSPFDTDPIEKTALVKQMLALETDRVCTDLEMPRARAFASGVVPPVCACVFISVYSTSLKSATSVCM